MTHDHAHRPDDRGGAPWEVAPWRALRTSFPCWRSSIWPLPSCSAARPRSSWPSSVVVVAAFAALRLQDWVDPVVALVVAALALVLWGAVRGQLRRGGALVVEMAGFTAIALAAVSVDPDLDRYIVAAGWFG